MMWLHLSFFPNVMILTSDEELNFFHCFIFLQVHCLLTVIIMNSLKEEARFAPYILVYGICSTISTTTLPCSVLLKIMHVLATEGLFTFFLKDP